MCCELWTLIEVHYSVKPVFNFLWTVKWLFFYQWTMNRYPHARVPLLIFLLLSLTQKRDVPVNLLIAIFMELCADILKRFHFHANHIPHTKHSGFLFTWSFQNTHNTVHKIRDIIWVIGSQLNEKGKRTPAYHRAHITILKKHNS